MKTYKRKPRKAVLILEDGVKYYGWSFSKPMTSIGEVIFNTGTTGYQEIMTDPSYKGQIITFTYPELGNTGINKEDNESSQAYLRGIITKNLSTQPSNWRSDESLINYLEKTNIIHIYGIDTRALTRHLRKQGTMNGCISTEYLDTNYLYNQLQLTPQIKGQDLVKDVSTQKPYKWETNIKQLYQYQYKKIHFESKNLNIIVIDFGTKYNILRYLSCYVKNIIVVPAQYTWKQILKYKPDGILLSNGPGDPEVIDYGIKNVQKLLNYKIPILGICMGHQILSLALNLKSFKLKFGHRGLNHPIGNDKTIEITSQNHGFAIENSVKQNQTTALIQINCNDLTLAAISHKKFPFFSVQYHPEANPGPHDAAHLFLHFIRIIQWIKKYPNLII
uniref:Carbamoyl phosphate synthase small chain n=1 Tax=Kumanoa americana TaxID=1196377 RepID=A0A1C9CGQ0_9FLOR|nr:carbamoyl-phosphate synthase arginine-specific small subunit [Kumanoa americana]AOM67549.1 carbamoyl-phosphate synthase arginine-specific small subunit [Kumanoa americana]